MNKFLIVIAGPTAVGKTALSISLARHFNTEIISADSRQFYKELTIGTAKPTLEQLGAVKHHFINSLSIGDEYAVADFEKDAIDCIDRIHRQNNVAILTGGSGLFIDAVCKGLNELPAKDEVIRLQIQSLLKQEGIIKLQEKLKELDPITYNRIDLSNTHRLVRALEVCLITGKPYSAFLNHQSLAKRNFRTIKIVLDLNRKELYKRIDDRVDEMMAGGLFAEVKGLQPFFDRNALNTVGYKEFKDYFDRKKSIEETIDSIKQNSRRYAKRQLTWFRKDSDYQWFNPSKLEEIILYIHTRLEEA